MSSRALVWTLAILAIVLVVVPLLSMLAMSACCGGMMGIGGGTMAMPVVGLIWTAVAAAVVIALVVMLVRGVSRT